ncbi:MAG: hypothetical protein H6Q67_654 [Firmicutes bacterium]|nr:hypothetical protein [Bacillota bacterium]
MTKIFELIAKYTPAPFFSYSYNELQRQNNRSK